jgi:uncharacterized protein (TIGR00369 family)
MKKTIFDSIPMPPASGLLGWTLIDVDPDAGTIDVAFEGKPEFINPAGFIQGGFLTAMLDDTLGPAILVATKGRKYGHTIDLHTHFLRPVAPGRITTTGKVTSLGKTVAYLEGQLFDAGGKLAARATASAFLSDFDPG